MGDGVKHDSMLSIFKEIDEAVREGTRKAALEMPRLITDQLKVGLKPDGSSQPSNALRTLEDKRRRGVGNVSGVDSGTLSNPTNWTVTQSSDGFIVEPPRERDAAINALEARGYEFIGLPVGADELIEASIKAEFKRVT